MASKYGAPRPSGGAGGYETSTSAIDRSLGGEGTQVSRSKPVRFDHFNSSPTLASPAP
jgi:hypothetical protein